MHKTVYIIININTNLNTNTKYMELEYYEWLQPLPCTTTQYGTSISTLHWQQGAPVEAGGQAVASRCSQLFELSFLSKSTRQN